MIRISYSILENFLCSDGYGGFVPRDRTDHDSGSNGQSNVSRRRLLQSAIAGSTVGLAGCASGGNQTQTTTDSDGGDGSGGDNGSDGDGGGGGQPADPTFSEQTWTVPTDAQFNPFNPKGFAGGPAAIIFDPLVQFNSETNEFIPYLAKEWSIGGKKITLTLESGRKWHNGDALTTEDLKTEFLLAKYNKNPAWDYIDSVEVISDTEFQFNLKSAYNERVLLHDVISHQMRAPRSVYADKLKALQDASSEDERQQALKDLTSFTLSEPVGNGPFKFEQAGSQKMELSLFEDHPAASELNFPKYEFIYASTAQKGWAALRTGKIDGNDSWYTPPNVVENYPDHVMEIMAPIWTDYGLTFQLDDDVFSDPRFRRAIAHVLDRKEVAKNIGPRTREPINLQTGMSKFVKDQYLSKDLQGKFSKYEPNKEKAASQLQEIGLSKEGGQWVRPDGSALELPVKVCAGCSDFVSGTQTLTSQLSQFGINADTVTVEGASFWKQYSNGNFKAAATQWGAWGIPYPYFDYQRSLASQSAHQYYNYPSEVEVPMPVGDSSGSTETVNVDKKIQQLARSAGDTANQLIAELAWVFNQTLPKIQMSDRIDQAWMTTDDWKIPSKDAEVMQVKYPVHWLPRVGELKAKTE